MPENSNSWTNKGFTLVEIIVVVTILGILAAVALPRMIAPKERVIVSEGMQDLIVMKGAQERYKLENGSYYASAVDCNAMDVSVTPTNFNAPVCPGAAAVVSIDRKGGPVYTLSIDALGIVTCSGTCTGVCTKGGGNQCN